MIQSDDIKKLADLAHLSVSPEEMESLATEMEEILNYVKDVKKVAGTTDSKTEKPVLRNVVREDEVLNTPGQYTEDIVSQFPDREGDALKVTKIL